MRLIDAEGGQLGIMSLEEALEAARHKAEEHGEEFDPSTVTGPETTYRIRGHGALIAD